MKPMKLICLPFAGASGTVYKRWSKKLSESIRVTPIELAGRGGRMGEDLYTNIESATEDIYSRVFNLIDDSPYALFGHSFGALLCFELYHKIKQHGEKRLPQIIYLSGSIAPHLIKKMSSQIHLLPDELFLKEIIGLGLTPVEFLEDKKLADLFLSTIKNDYRLFETYRCNERDKITSEVHILEGDNDNHSSRMAAGWDVHVSEESLSFKTFPGGHFFIFDDEVQMQNYINRTMLGEETKEEL